MGRKFAQIAWAHGRRKTHKPFEHIPRFRPITETTNTPCYGISKFLSNLLNTLTENQCVVKYSFTAANKIRKIPKELFDHGSRFVSFDVEWLFTSVPLSKTINIILDRTYNKKLLEKKHQETNNEKTFERLLHQKLFFFQQSYLRTNGRRFNGIIFRTGFCQYHHDWTIDCNCW